MGVNNSLNTETKPVGISHNMGSSKLKLPHSIVETNPKPKIPPTQNEKPAKGQNVTTLRGKSDVTQSKHEVQYISIYNYQRRFSMVSISVIGQRPPREAEISRDYHCFWISVHV